MDLAWSHAEPYTLVYVGLGTRRVSAVTIPEGSSCGDMLGHTKDVWTTDITAENRVVVCGKEMHFSNFSQEKNKKFKSEKDVKAFHTKEI